MKILVVTQYFWPENFRINDLVLELQKRGHEIEILTGRPNYPTGVVFPEYLEDPQQFNRFNDIPVIRVPMVSRGTTKIRLVLNYFSFAFYASVMGAWVYKKRDFDVIFVYEPSPVTVALPAILLSKLYKIPVVFWVLDLWPDSLRAVDAVKSKFILSLVERLVRFIYRNCTLVLGQSRSFVNQIERYTVDQGNVRYYPSWSEDLFINDSVPKAEEINSEANTFNVMFAGNIGDAQDFPSILSAAELLSDDPKIRWYIIGDGRKYQWLKNEIEQRGLSKTMFPLGRFPVDRMPSFYEHAHALLVTLKNDPAFSMTIPAKLQTYLAFGKPILGMLDGEGAASIKDAKAGLSCKAGDAAGLAEAIKLMASMTPDELKTLGNNGRAYAAKEFDRNTLVSKLEYYFEEAIFRFKNSH
jgi:glycosyltransferase involved in cell wall biosynthesis